jgi:ABC-2 type transport system permease protein
VTRSTSTVIWLTWRQLFARRRVWVAAAIAVFPLFMTFIYRFSSPDLEGDRLLFMLGLLRELHMGVLLPLAALIFGTTAFGGEVEDGTLVYLLVKPARRWRVVLIKYFVALVVTSVVIGISILLPWWALRNAELPLVFLRGFLVATVVGAAIYCAVFLLLGLITRRGLLFGLLYVIFIEQVMSRNFDGIATFSAREHALAVAQWAGGGMVRWPTDPLAMKTVWTITALAVAIAVALTMRRFSRYELAEKL